jgi:YgiT-type zinc finger domain-containing protein
MPSPTPDCFSCETGVLQDVIEPYTITLLQRGTVTIPDVPMLRCPHCHEVFLNGIGNAVIEDYLETTPIPKPLTRTQAILLRLAAYILFLIPCALGLSVHFDRLTFHWAVLAIPCLYLSTVSSRKLYTSPRLR